MTSTSGEIMLYFHERTIRRDIRHPESSLGSRQYQAWPFIQEMDEDDIAVEALVTKAPPARHEMSADGVTSIAESSFMEGCEVVGETSVAFERRGCRAFVT